MEYIILGNFIVFSLTVFICTFVGLDLKKWSTWLIGLYGFLSGLAFCFTDWGSPSGLPVKAGFQLGLLFAFVAMFAGVMTRHKRQVFGNLSKNWIFRYGQDERYLHSPLSPLIKIMRKLVEKYR